METFKTWRVKRCRQRGRFSTAALVLLQMAWVLSVSATQETNTAWVDAWGTSYLFTVINGTPQSVPTFSNQTFRVNMYTRLGGTAVRIKFTDRFATNPVVIGEAHVALRTGSTGSDIVPSSDRLLTFGGDTNLTLAIGEERWSDPVDLVVTQHQEMAVSVFLPQLTKPSTFHPTGLKRNYYSTGDHCGDTTLTGTSFTTADFFVVDVQVLTEADSRVVVTLGDSITDGTFATTDGNASWPDVLSKRLPSLPDGTPVGVLNMGIGSNRLMTTNAAGPPGLDRLDDDVLSRQNVSHIILLEGINDISYEHVLPEDLIGAYQQVINRAHAKGIKVFGATLLPIGNSVKYTVTNEATRQAVNTWVRQSGQFDAVLDFEQVVADTSFDPLRIKSNLQGGDYVHPNTTGYQLMAQSIPLNLFNAQLGTFYAPSFATNGAVQWWLDLNPAHDYAIEASTNLIDWVTYLNATNVSSILLSDPDSVTGNLRFFRSRQVD